MTTIITLLVIGLLAGVLSGFVGIGGGLLVVPALVIFLGLTQHQAQGTSLAMMLPPIGVLAVYNYYKGGHLDNTLLFYGGLLALTFFIGGYFGSRISISLSPQVVKKVFGVLMLVAAVKLIFFSK